MLRVPTRAPMIVMMMMVIMYFSVVFFPVHALHKAVQDVLQVKNLPFELCT